jgi:hypothetical protein
MDAPEKPKVVAKRCQKCGLPSPSTAARCRCGHDFSEVAASKPAVQAPAPIPEPPAAPATTVVTEPKTFADYKKLFTRQNAPGGIIGGLAGLGGALVGIYCGLNLVIPFAASMAAIWVLQQTIKGASRPFVHAAGVQIGHLTWFFFGLLVAGLSQLGQVMFDATFMIAGIVWLLMKPGEWPVRALLAWQVLAIIVNLALLLSARPASQEHRALVAHLAMRGAAIAYLITGLKEWRKSVQATPAVKIIIG